MLQQILFVNMGYYLLLERKQNKIQSFGEKVK